MGDVYDELCKRLIRDDADLGSREVLQAAIRMVVDVTHEAGTYEGTVDACLMSFWNSLGGLIELPDQPVHLGELEIEPVGGGVKVTVSGHGRVELATKDCQ